MELTVHLSKEGEPITLSKSEFSKENVQKYEQNTFPMGTTVYVKVGKKIIGWAKRFGMTAEMVKETRDEISKKMEKFEKTETGIIMKMMLGSLKVSDIEMDEYCSIEPPSWAGYCVMPFNLRGYDVCPEPGGACGIITHPETLDNFESFNFSRETHCDFSMELQKYIICWYHNHSWNVTADGYQTLENVVGQIKECHEFLTLNETEIKAELDRYVIPSSESEDDMESEDDTESEVDSGCEYDY
jgi:hypothetical protein